MHKALAVAARDMGACVSTKRHERRCGIEVFTGLALLGWLLHVRSCPLVPVMSRVAVGRIRRLRGAGGHVGVRVGVGIRGRLGYAG